MDLIPFERECKTLRGVRNAFNANFKFKGVDGRIVRKSDVPDGTIVTIVFGQGKISFTCKNSQSSL